MRGIPGTITDYTVNEAGEPVVVSPEDEAIREVNTQRQGERVAQTRSPVSIKPEFRDEV